MVKKTKKKSVVKKVVEKITKLKRIETTDPDEFARLFNQGYKVIAIRSEIKGSDIVETIPKTYVLEK